MQQLNQKTLAMVADQGKHMAKCLYDREEISPGIVHFGVGNFHRCHQAVYIDSLLDTGRNDWGIVGVSMRSSRVRDALLPQDFLYTQVTLGADTAFRVIGSILNILVAPEDPDAVISQVAESRIKLVTTTITEKGYCLDSGHINQEDPDLAADFASLESPRTIYGYLAASLIRRRNKGGAPLSILCCDNIQNGGGHLESGVQMLLRRHDVASSHWAADHVSFASSMVDRVSPATQEPLKRLVGSTLGLEDSWPVSAEPFSQWVIEDKFAAERPDLDMVGAVFAKDISLYEQMKLRFLNAGHSIISILGYLDHQPTVHQALEQPLIHDFVRDTLFENVLPVSTLPEHCNGGDYIMDVLQRFTNGALPYAVQQVNTDSSQKIQQRWFPTIDDALAQSADTSLMSLSVAAWVLYIQQALQAGELNDPRHDDFLIASQQKNDRGDDDIVHGFVLLAGAEQFQFYNSVTFMDAVIIHYTTLKQTGITDTLSRLRTRRKELKHA